MLRKGLFILLLCCYFIQVTGQKTFIHTDEYKSYKYAQELYDKQKYSAAQAYFKEIINEIPNTQDELRINAEYYFAVCALHLYHHNVETLLTRFVLDHPDHPKSERVYLQLARHYYRMKKFTKSIEYFEKIDQYDLSIEDQNEFLFKLGYSKFMRKKKDEAKVNFNELLQRESDYKVPATYYYSHIAYEEGKYQTALVGFRSISKSKMFKSIIPYYITQILYQQHKYDDLIAYAPVYIDSVIEKRKGEFAKLIGDSYYKNQDYIKAIDYYKAFKKYAKADRESNYQVAFSYYKLGNFEKAISLFSRVVYKSDVLSQTSYYHMADAYLRLDEKDYARNAFQEASKLDFDEEIKRNSLFNYAKLAFEMSYNPYDEAINAFHEFIETYPNTEDAKEAYEFLLKVYLTTKNYDDALTSLEKIKEKDPRMQSAYQTIVYNRAVEHFHNRNYSDAIQSFDLVRRYPIDQKLNALSEFWKAECFYKSARFGEAISTYEKYRYTNGALLTSEYNDLDFHLGYAYFEKATPYTNVKSYNVINQKNDLDKSIQYFRNYIHQLDFSDSSRYHSALVRIADAYFVLKNDSLAIENYQKSLNVEGINHSYALYQLSTSQGLIQDYDGKMETLQKLTDEYPESRYQVLSLLNLAQTYKDLEKNTEAINTYLKFIDEYPNNNFISTAFVEVGSIYIKEGNLDEGEKYLLTVLDSYPDAEIENELAVELMMEVYAKRNDLPGYYAWLDKRGIAVSEQQKDSTFWQPVQLARDNGDCDLQIEKATYYLDNISNPIKEISAHYYMATCYYTSGQKNEALYHYDFITTKPNNNYFTESLKYAGEITFESENYKLALGHFSTLENVGVTQEDLSLSKRGQMYCFYYLHNFQSAIIYSKKVLLLNHPNDKVIEDAHLFLANSYKELGFLDSALISYENVIATAKSEAAAEAKYNMCHIYHLNKDYENCEKQIMELVQQKPTYDYWLAKGILLLGDNFTQLKDYFNAKHSIQSIIDNYDGPKKDEILAEAEQKLEYVKNLEQIEINDEPDQEEIEIDFQDIDPKDQELFEEPSTEKIEDNENNEDGN